MISLDKANTKDSNRYRQSSIWVDGVEYEIKTPFPYWIAFGNKIKDYKSIDEFNPIYKDSIPANKEAGLLELFKFFIDDQPLPRNMGDELNIEIIDWIIDSEYIYAAFLSQYNIDLELEDIHWHKFRSLFKSLKGHVINDIMSYRTWIEPKVYKDEKKKQKAENEEHNLRKQRWELRKEKIKLFEMK